MCTRPDFQKQVLLRMMWEIAHIMGIEDVDMTPDAVKAFSGQDPFTTEFHLQGHSVDSLALTEVLVRIEEELETSFFDDERVDDAETIGQLVTVVLEHVPNDVLNSWLANWIEECDDDD